MSFEDMWDNLDIGVMGIFEARKGRWIFALDAVYFRLNKQETESWTGPGGRVTIDGAVEATMTQQLYQGSIGYRIIDDKTKLDLIGGLRYNIVENELDLVLHPIGEVFPGDKRNISESENWVDPVFGIRLIVPFSPKWSCFGYGDIGGFGVGSYITYQAMGGIRWQFSKVVSAKLAYRYLYQDFEEDDFKWDMSYQGPVIGIGFSF